VLAVTGFVLVAAACARGPEAPHAQPEGEPDLGGLEKIDHLIFIVQENRSFDHYFGIFPGADGIELRKDGCPGRAYPTPSWITARGPTTAVRSSRRGDRTRTRRPWTT